MRQQREGEDQAQHRQRVAGTAAQAGERRETAMGKTGQRGVRFSGLALL
jgi:hypothetical protein